MLLPSLLLFLFFWNLISNIYYLFNFLNIYFEFLGTHVVSDLM